MFAIISIYLILYKLIESVVVFCKIIICFMFKIRIHFLGVKRMNIIDWSQRVLLNTGMLKGEGDLLS